MLWGISGFRLKLWYGFHRTVPVLAIRIWFFVVVVVVVCCFLFLRLIFCFKLLETHFKTTVDLWLLLLCGVAFNLMWLYILYVYILYILQYIDMWLNFTLIFTCKMSFWETLVFHTFIHTHSFGFYGYQDDNNISWQCNYIMPSCGCYAR